MKSSRSFIGPASTRRRIATVVAVIGVVLVGTQLVRVWPRNQDVRYELGPGATELQVDYVQENEAITSVRFRALSDETTVIRHTVRLQPGTYGVRITVYGSEGSMLEQARTLAVPAQGAALFDLRETPTRAE